MVISLLYYFLWPYNWLSWLLLHWAMLLVPLECSKMLFKSHSIIGWKARFDQFSSFSFFPSFLFQPSYPCPIKASWVSFFTVLQCLSQECATTGSKQERRHFLLMEFMVVSVQGICGLMSFKVVLKWCTWIQLSLVKMLCCIWLVL